MDAHRLEIRHARAADLRHLAAIEQSGGAQFEALFGEDTVPALLAPAPGGAERAAKPGFLLVAGDPPVAFAHVVEMDGYAHLDQLSVLPQVQRRGIGAALVKAVIAEARASGFHELSLCTYRDVPWNGPWYRALGFGEVTELEPYQRRLRKREAELGLDHNGTRVVMSIPVRHGKATGE